MELSNILEFVIGGFYSALSKFGAEFNLKQEQRDMVLTDKLNQVLQNQSASEALVTSINDTIKTETAEITQSLATLTSTNASQAQTITDQGNQIKQLLSEVEEGKTTLAQAESIVDSIIQKQQDDLTTQQGLVTKISDIFTPPTPMPVVPPTTEATAPVV